MHNLLAYESLTVELLLVATITAIIVRRFRVPYTVALVVVGALLATPGNRRPQPRTGDHLARVAPAAAV